MRIYNFIVMILCCFSFAVTNSPIHASEKLEPVTIQLKWFHQFQFAGFYAAIEKGFYAEEGLDVTLRERTLETDHIGNVLKGMAEYGVSDAGLLLSRLQGKPVVLLAQIFQHSPYVFLSLTTSGIKTPFGMKGKSIIVEKDYSKDTALNALLVKMLNPEDIIFVPKPFRNEDLSEGRADVMGAYITDQPFWFKERGMDTNVIDPRDYGIDFYGDNLFTTEKEIREHPQRVKKMIRASIKGWQYALEHKDEIIDLIIEKYTARKLTREHLVYEAKETEKMVVPQFIDIGHFELSRFQKILEIYNQLSLTNLTRMDEGFFYKGNKPVLELTREEQVWLEEHPKIRIGIMNAWPPMNYVDDQGIPKGIGVDYIKEFNTLLNGVLTIVPGSFKENLELVKGKKLDAMLDITPKKEREKFFNFTRPYLTIPHVIVGRNDGPHFKSEKDLAGKTIALEEGFYNVKYFRKNFPEVTVKEYSSTSKALGSVIRGEADAYAGNRAVVTYFIEQELMTNLKIQGRMKKPPTLLCMGVRKDWSELTGIINKAFTAIPDKKHREIHRQWTSFGKMDDQTLLGLTKEEHGWLAAHPIITVAIDPKWAPVESVNINGEHEGITREYLDRIAKMLGVKFQTLTDTSWVETEKKVKSGEIDMFTAVMQTSERKSYLNFTDSYIELSPMIFTLDDYPFVHDIRDLYGKRVCMIKGYASVQVLQLDHPAIELVEADNPKEALTLLVTGQVDAYFNALLTTAYHMAEGGFTHIKVAGTLPYRLDLSMGVRKELSPLVPILNKALANISDEEKHQIIQKWHSIKHEVRFDYSLVWKILLPIVFIFAAMIYWNRRLSLEVAERQRAEQKTSMAASLLRATIESTTDGILVVDSSQKITSYNQRFLEIWNLDRELAKTSSDDVLLGAVLTQVDDPEVFLDRIKYLYATPEEEDFTTLSLRDGRVLERYSKPQQLDDQVVGRVWNFRDVTTSKNDEVMLLRNERRLKQAQSMAQLGNWELDHLTNKRSWSDEIYRIFGLQPQALMATYELFMDCVHPNDREIAKKALSDSLERKDEGYEIEYRIVCKDTGTVRYVFEKCEHKKDVSGNIIRSVGMVQNITDRRQIEEKLQKLSQAVEQSPVSIVITDAKGTIEYINPKFVEVTGYSAEDAIGQNPRILSSGDQPLEFYREMWETITSGWIWRGEFHNRTKKGQSYWELASISPIFNAQREITHYVAVKEDISDRKQTEKNLKDNYEALERFRKMAVEREIKMVELKKELNELLVQTGGKKKRYKIVQL